MSNTSATGGYLVPSSNEPLPGSLSLEDFIQTVIVGISGFIGTLVRPKWQEAPAKQPDINENWISFGIKEIIPDASAYAWLDEANVNQLARMERVEIQVSFYGPLSLENISIFRDGFQIQQNLEALSLAQMGFYGISQATRAPDLVNQRWVNRFETVLSLVRTVRRSYPVLSFASARGSIHTVIGNDEKTIQFLVEE